jgi:hypothetical protein
MADQTTATTPTPAASVTAEPAPSDPPKKYESMDSIFDEILDRSGLESFKDVVRTKRACWVDPEGKMMIFDLGQPSPFLVDDQVLGIFHDDTEMRIFTFPKKEGELKRYCLSKLGRAFVLDTFPDIEMWIDDMAEEYGILGGIEPDDDVDEPETPPANGATTTS